MDDKTAVITGGNTGIGKATAQDFYTRDYYKVVNMGSSNSIPEVRLDGKTVIVTGANTGIGKPTAQNFYIRGAHVILACRNLEKAKVAVDDIKEACKDKQNLGTIEITQLDLSSLRSVRECAERLNNSERRIDILVNNAGLLTNKLTRTEDGFEMQMGTNHLGHFLFTLLLLPKICESTPARIVNVSSVLHRGKRINLKDLNWEKKQYDGLVAYQQTKLANILFTKELAKRLKENNIEGVTTYALHPGFIKTDILNRNESENSKKFKERAIEKANEMFGKTPEEGSKTTIYCAVDERCANETGLYYSDSSKACTSSAAKKAEDAKRLWELSWKLVGLPEDYNPFVQVS